MVERNRKKGRSLKRACLPMASVLVIRPEQRFRHVPLQGQLHSTRPDAPEEQLVSPEDRLAYVRRRRLRLLGTSGVGVRRAKAALSSGGKSHPAIAPAGSNRSSHGGNEVAEAFGMRVTNW